jgi:hypothetical protein
MDGGRVRAASARRRVALRWRARGPVNVFHNGRRIAHVKPGRHRLVESIRRHGRTRHFFRVCRAEAPKSCSRRATVRLRRR